MITLSELQAQFQSYFLDEKFGIESSVVSTPKAPAAKRLAIYGDAYRLRLLESLQADYPKLEMLMGEEMFAKVAFQYIHEHASEFRSLRWYGMGFCDYLATHPDYEAQEQFSDMALWESCVVDAFDAEDAACLQMETLGVLAPEAWANLMLKAHPSVQRVGLAFNVPEIWGAFDAEEVLPELKALEDLTGYVLWRNDLHLHFAKLEVDEAWALDAVLQGETFGVICEGLCEWVDPEHAATRAAGFLRGWVELGLLAQLT